MIIDGHTHVVFSASRMADDLRAGRKILDTDIKKFLRIHDELGIQKIVVYGQDMTRVWNSSQFGRFDEVVALRDAYPDRVVAVGSVDPIDSKNRLNRAGLRQFEDAVTNHGVKGLMLGAGYGHWYPNDRRLYPFYERAEALGVPIAFHLGTAFRNPAGATVCPIQYGRPWLLDEVLIDFPQLRVNIEHMGHPWEHETIAMMAHAENLFTDIALLYRWPTQLAWNLAMAKEHGVIDQVLWGSDRITWGPSGEGTKESLESELDLIQSTIRRIARKSGWPTLTDEDIEGVLGKTAARFYGI